MQKRTGRSIVIPVVNLILVAFLVVCALVVASVRDLMAAIVVFSAYSAVMSILWLLLLAPDVAMTEAAIGVGANTVMFVAVVSRIRRRSA